MTDYKRVYVKWVDSCALDIGARWTHKDELDFSKGETICESLGWLVETNEHSIYVTGHMSPEEVGQVTQIPRVAVKELNYLETDDPDQDSCQDGRGQVFPVLGLG